MGKIRHVPFREALRQAREAAGLSRSELAERMGVSAPVVTRWEDDSDNLKEATVRRYAEALRLEIRLVGSPTVRR